MPSAFGEDMVIFRTWLITNCRFGVGCEDLPFAFFIGAIRSQETSEKAITGNNHPLQIPFLQVVYSKWTLISIFPHLFL